MTTNTPNPEPVLTLGSVTAAVAAVIALVVAFGLNLSTAQQIAILGSIGPVGLVVLAVLARRKVTPSAQVVVKDEPGVGFVAGEASEIDNGTPVDVVEAA